MPEDQFEFVNGALLDTRTEDEQLKDFFIHEIVASASAVNWVEKPESQWRKFPDQFQDSSGSCVAQTLRKLARISFYLMTKIVTDFSATFIYWNRSNKPSGGMFGVQAFDFWKNLGIPLNEFLKSDDLSDSEMDAAKIDLYHKEMAKVFRIGGHVGIPSQDFETVASTIQATGKGVMVWFYFLADEWSPFIPVVKNSNLQLNGVSTLRHSVATVDFTLQGGKKYLIIEDSSPFGGKYRRLISEEFFKARNYFARYPMNLVYQDQTQPTPTPEPVPVNPKPQHHFSMPLNFQTTNPDVKALQDILKYEGFFPINTDSTGYYGAITAKGVLAFQKKYSVAPLAELESLQGRRCGEKTITKLNQLYG